MARGEEDVGDLGLHERRKHYDLLVSWIQLRACGGGLHGREEQMGRVKGTGGELGFQRFADSFRRWDVYWPFILIQRLRMR
jgi:hypothetical protein